MSKAVGHTVSGINAGSDDKVPFDLVVMHAMQEVADAHNSRGAPGEINHLPCGPALAQGFRHIVCFSAPSTQIMVGDARVNRLQRDVRQDQLLVRRIPKPMAGRCVWQVLRTHWSAESRQQQENLLAHENKLKRGLPSQKITEVCVGSFRSKKWNDVRNH